MSCQFIFRVSDVFSDSDISFFSLQVFQDCGQPRLGKRQAVGGSGVAAGGFGFNSNNNNGGGGKNNPPAVVAAAATANGGKPATSAGPNLDSLVNEILGQVKDTKGFWSRLPYILCQNPDVGSGKDSVEQNCWNGRERGVYAGRVMNDGLASQEQNPEVSVDVSVPDGDINEQIFALKLVANKLENAYNGHAVEWPHYESSKCQHTVQFMIKLSTVHSISCVPSASCFSVSRSLVGVRSMTLIFY